MTNSATRRHPLLVLGLDAGDLALVQRWTDSGELPNLRALRDKGAWAPLDGVHDFNSFSVWPAFATGATPSDHAYYSHVQLVPGSYEMFATKAAGMRVPPFYAQLADPGLRVLCFDIPKMGVAPGVNGVQVAEWGAKSPADNPASDPPELIAQLNARYGIHTGTLHDEDRAESPRYFERLLEELLESCRKRTEIALELLRREAWDLFIAVYSESHSVGHRFLHFLEGYTERGEGHDSETLRNAVLSVYREIDAGIGRIVEAAPDEATILACSMHGIGLNENSEADELLPELLRRFSSVERNESRSLKSRLASRLWVAAHTLVPSRARDLVKHQMSQGARKRYRLARYERVHDRASWPEMLAFSLPSDEAGFIRLNVIGREPQGRVRPEDFDRVCDELSEVLLGLRDAPTGKPVVREVSKVRDLQQGACLDALPDLIVQWTTEHVSTLESPRFGHLGAFEAHRAGTHRPRGFLVAAGPGIAHGAELEGGSVFDIAPTVLSLLGEPEQEQMVGRPLLLRPNAA